MENTRLPSSETMRRVPFALPSRPNLKPLLGIALEKIKKTFSGHASTQNPKDIRQRAIILKQKEKEEEGKFIDHIKNELLLTPLRSNHPMFFTLDQFEMFAKEFYVQARENLENQGEDIHPEAISHEVTRLIQRAIKLEEVLLKLVNELFKDEPIASQLDFGLAKLGIGIDAGVFYTAIGARKEECPTFYKLWPSEKIDHYYWSVSESEPPMEIKAKDLPKLLTESLC